MAIGGGWDSYPWGPGNATGGAFNYWTSSATAHTIEPVWFYNTGGSYYPSPVPYHEKITEKVEDAMDWLRRRVTEITDLAYAEV